MPFTDATSVRAHSDISDPSAKISAPTKQHLKRVQYIERPNESEKERQARRRREAGTRHARNAAHRAADAEIRRELFPAGSFSTHGPPPAHVAWPPPPKRAWRRDLTPTDKARTVDDYFQVLSSLPARLHVCPNCHELDCTHGTADATAKCAFCANDSSRLHPSNGLDLGMKPQHEPDKNSQGEPDWEKAKQKARDKGDMLEAGRAKWQWLKQRWGGLTVVEEALISPVIAVKGVLRLPNGKQMAYSGSFINFTQQMSTVALQLPRALKDTGIAVWRAEGQDCSSTLLRVRKEAVREHFDFFCEYHAFFRSGIPNPNASGDGPDAYLVPPANSLWSKAAFNALPVDGQVLVGEKDGKVGLEENLYEADDEVDEDNELPGEAGKKGVSADARAESATGGTPPTGSDAPSQSKQPRVGVNSKLFARWLRESSGVTAQHVRVALTSHGLNAYDDHGLEAILNQLHGVSATDCRLDVISLPAMARRLCDEVCAIQSRTIPRCGVIARHRSLASVIAFSHRSPLMSQPMR